MASWWDQLKAALAQGTNISTDIATAPLRAAKSWLPEELEHHLLGFSRNQPAFRPTPVAPTRPTLPSTTSPSVTPSSATTTSVDNLFARFLELLQQEPQVNSYANQVNPIYDARIAALQDLMSRAEQRVGQGKQEIGDMYGALAENYEELAPQVRQQAEEAQQDVSQLFGELRSTVEGHYTKVAKEQADLYRQLGIEAAAPEVLGSQGERQAEGMALADTLGAINEQRMADIGEIDESYYRQGAPLARLTGSNKQTDLMQQLEDYLANTSSEISMAEAERTSALAQLQAQAQREAAQQQQQQMQMLWQVLQSQAQAENVELTPDLLLQQLPTQLRSEVSNAYRQIERSEPILANQVSGRIPGTSVTTPDEYWLELAQIMYENGDISSQAYSALSQLIRLKHELPMIGY
jgi:nucleotide-binding universal stress UspA family protein